MDLPTLGLVVGSAAIDSINPCAIAILVLVLAATLGSGKSTKHLVATGLTLIFSIFVTYLLIGSGLAYSFFSINPAIAEYLSIGVGLLVVLAGIVQIKDYFWYGKGLSLQIPTRYANKIHKYSTKQASFMGTALLGAFIAIVELPCTGAPYLAIINILSVDFSAITIWILAMYSFIFVLPLIIILLIVASGAKLSAVIKWKEESKGTMRLFTGLLLVALGWILMLIANGTVNFG